MPTPIVPLNSPPQSRHFGRQLSSRTLTTETPFAQSD